MDSQNRTALKPIGVQVRTAQLSKLLAFWGAHAATLRKRGANDAVLVYVAVVMNVTHGGANPEKENHHER